MDRIWVFEMTSPAPGLDPMLTYAMTVLAADKRARLRGITAGFGRVEVEPGQAGTPAERVVGWLTARGSEAELEAYIAEVIAQARARAERDGTRLSVSRP